jgi:hypothetical protein
MSKSNFVCDAAWVVTRHLQTLNFVYRCFCAFYRLLGLFESVPRLYQVMDGDILGRTELKSLSGKFYIDFAALVLADQLSSV